MSQSERDSAVLLILQRALEAFDRDGHATHSADQTAQAVRAFQDGRRDVIHQVVLGSMVSEEVGCRQEVYGASAAINFLLATRLQPYGTEEGALEGGRLAFAPVATDIDDKMRALGRYVPAQDQAHQRASAATASLNAGRDSSTRSQHSEDLSGNVTQDVVAPPTTHTAITKLIARQPWMHSFRSRSTTHWHAKNPQKKLSVWRAPTTAKSQVYQYGRASARYIAMLEGKREDQIAAIPSKVAAYRQGKLRIINGLFVQLMQMKS